MTERKRMSLPALIEKAGQGVPITWLTCYDYPTAYLQDQAGIDMILVGDSLGPAATGTRLRTTSRTRSTRRTTRPAP